MSDLESDSRASRKAIVEILEERGILAFFTRHGTAANLLMAVMIIAGLIAAGRLNTQFFPSAEIPVIRVHVAWPGASANAVEQNIINVVEPALRFLDGVDRVTSTSREGGATIVLEYPTAYDMQLAAADVDTALAGVNNLPEDAETPEYFRVQLYEDVAKVSVSGPFPEKALAGYARDIRDRLLAAGIGRVNIVGMRDEEIAVDVSAGALERFGLGINDVAKKIAANSSDTPSGVTEGESWRQLRVMAAGADADAVGQLEMLALPDGRRVLLRDIAQVYATFASDDETVLDAGQTAVELEVQRAISADTLKTAAIVRDEVEKLRSAMPEKLEIRLYDRRSAALEDRINLLVKNGASGLALVLAVLFLFLNLRIAFWVAMGIPTALFAAIGLMLFFGMTINMISLFALIMVLGIVVDDAIVVGEQTATNHASGMDAWRAARSGAGIMMMPVMAASLTTIAAFLPTMIVGGTLGAIMSDLPKVVAMVLAASLLESFVILPSHLGHSLAAARRKPARFRFWFDGHLARFRDGPFRRAVHLSVYFRYTTVAAAMGILLISIAMLRGGLIGFSFFPTAEAERIYVTASLVPGLQAEKFTTMVETVSRSITDTVAELGRQAGGEELTEASIVHMRRESNSIQVALYLTASEQRSVRTSVIERAINSNMPQLAGVDRVSVRGPRGGPPGRDIDVKFSGDSVSMLDAAAREFTAILDTMPEVSAVSTSLMPGLPEDALTLRPRAAALGLSASDIAAQLRGGLDGVVARRIATVDNEIAIRVRLAQAGGFDPARMQIRTPAGGFIPLGELAEFRETPSYMQLVREDGQSVVRVQGDIAAGEQADVIRASFTSRLDAIAEKHGLTWKFGGRAEEQQDTFADLSLGAIIGVILIYVIMAWMFASYVLPLTIMLIIPFGLAGAITGHYVMGYDLTVVSMMGLLGLSGIVINDSIVFIERYRERRGNGDDIATAGTGAACDRLRAVLLTSLTTIGGLVPLMFEKSMQAQFLIPMAITMVFGLALTTVLVLAVTPAFIAIGGDIGGIFRAIYGNRAADGRRVGG